jgi:hypothetical protein
LIENRHSRDQPTPKEEIIEVEEKELRESEEVIELSDNSEEIEINEDMSEEELASKLKEALGLDDASVEVTTNPKGESPLMD